MSDLHVGIVALVSYEEALRAISVSGLLCGRPVHGV